MGNTDSFFTGLNPSDIRRQSTLTPLSMPKKGYCQLLSTVIEGRRVALKSLKEEYKSSEIHISLLRKEYDLCCGLYHPNIISVTGFVDHPEAGPSIIMEYIDGFTLSEFLRREGPLKYSSAKIILEQLCDAVEYLHSQGIIHRDIKPSNIMLTRFGNRVKLIDFGLSDSAEFTGFKYAGGTRHYSAPEQFDKEYKPDCRADIYSIGVIMSEMCPDAPATYSAISHSCQSEDPELRPEHVREILQLLSAGENRIRRLYRYTVACIFIILISALTFVLFQLKNKETPLPAVSDSTVTGISQPSSADRATLSINPSDSVLPEVAHDNKYEKPLTVAAPDISSDKNDSLIAELETYARKYTLETLTREYAATATDSTPGECDFQAITLHLSEYTKNKCGSNKALFKKAEPKVMEACHSISRIFHEEYLKALR